jgi:hypothetical protein
MSRLPVTPDVLRRHERSLRLLTVGALLGFPLMGYLGFVIPRFSIGVPPVWMTAAALAGGLLLSLRVEKVAQRLVISLKNRFASGGDVSRLLADHRRTLLLVLVMLEGIGLAGLLVAVAGSGPRAALWFHTAGVVLTFLAWPSEHKVRLLLRRAQELRDREHEDPDHPRD